MFAAMPPLSRVWILLVALAATMTTAAPVAALKPTPYFDKVASEKVTAVISETAAKLITLYLTTISGRKLTGRHP